MNTHVVFSRVLCPCNQLFAGGDDIQRREWIGMHTITDLGDLHPPLPYVEVALQSLVPVLDLDVFHDIGCAAVGQLVAQPLTEGLFLGTFLQGGETGERQVTVLDNIREMGEVLGRSVWA